MAYLSMMIKPFILLIEKIIVLFSGNLMQQMGKLLQVDMDKEIKQIN
jgi:hypothetical protein